MIDFIAFTTIEVYSIRTSAKIIMRTRGINIGHKIVEHRNITSVSIGSSEMNTSYLLRGISAMYFKYSIFRNYTVAAVSPYINSAII